MPKLKIYHYRMHFNYMERKNEITLVAQLGQELEYHTLRDLSASEFHAIGVMLREEKPIYYTPETGVLETAEEMVGEKELTS